MGIKRAMVSLPRESGLAEDMVTNTWYFNDFGGTASDADIHAAIQDRLTEFYTEPVGLGVALFELMHPSLTGVANLRIYDLADPEPRVPEFNINMNWWIPPTAQGVPEEVAVCMSYQAAPVSGTPQARRRGRLFIGPLNVSAVAEDTNNRTRPDTALIFALQGAAERLVGRNADDLTPGALSWVVVSQTFGNVNTITEGWVDNAFDTQRRRGVLATARNVWES